ncbi:MAG: ATP-grasp domain-containing protein [Verrucomicrobia bacterium]|nr:ATP-grasp domain-containing protein [Verrucomicrobiota bacterium]
MVIPCDDEDALAIASGAHIIKTCGVRTLLPLGDIVRSVKKENLETTLRRLGITVPRQVAISDISNLKMDELDFPVLVKGRLIHAYFARNEKEVRGFATKLSEVWGFPVIVQQFVNGAEFSVCAVADRQSRIAGLCAIRKQGISDQGKTWRAVTIDPDIFEPIVTGFVRGLNWVGPVELEFIMPPSGNQPVVIEVNPRFPAWVPISRRAEADLVKLVVELCQGKRPSKRIVAKAGMCFARTYRTGAFSMAAMARLYAHGSLPAERNGTLA